MSNSRVSVSLKDFLRVTVKERDTITTAQEAADALGYTSLESFKQALTRNRKRYPAIFDSVPKYSTSNGPNVATPEEAAALLAELNEDEADDTSEANA